MESIGVYEAKTHLNQLLDRAAKGEKITITKHGMPIAVLISADTSKRGTVRDAIDELKRFRNRHRLEGLALRNMIEEGRR